MHHVQHSGTTTVEHVHSLRFDSNALAAVRQLFLSVAVVVVGWIIVTAIQTFRGAPPS